MSPHPGWLDQAFSWPSTSGERVLCVGIGGGSDILGAWAVSRQLAPDTEIMLANTKRRIEDDWIMASPHIGRLPPDTPDKAGVRRGHGTTWIDRLLPGDAWIFCLPKDRERQDALAEELKALPIDRVFAIDMGGDVLGYFRPRRRRRTGRDQQMLRCLSGLSCPLHLVVLGPGCDGETLPDELRARIDRVVEAGRYQGCFSLTPLLNTFRAVADELPQTRTPRILLQAASMADDVAVMNVPRDRKPDIPVAWLRIGLVFDVSGLETRPETARRPR